MLNLFSMLLRHPDHSRLTEEVNALKSELSGSNEKIEELKTALVVTQGNIITLNHKLKELHGVNEILLSVQQHIIEELNGSSVSSKSALPLFSFSASDDDDLPN
jgi:dynactin complex subunit